MRWTGTLEPGQVYRKPVISLDLMPTFLVAAGAEIDPAWKLDGVDLLPHLTGKEAGAPHESLFWVWGHRKAIRSGDIKVMTQDGGKSYQMFDLSKDIGEANDIAARNPEKLQAMIRKHQDWESGLMPPQWGWNKALGYEDPGFGKPKPYHERK